MANRIPKLTKRAVEALKANGADTVYWDGELTGFGIRVRKSGRKNYVLQTRVRGKLRWFSIGQHGRITPDKARAAALEILAQTKMGIDPRERMRSARPSRSWPSSAGGSSRSMSPLTASPAPRGSTVGR